MPCPHSVRLKECLLPDFPCLLSDASIVSLFQWKQGFERAIRSIPPARPSGAVVDHPASEFVAPFLQPTCEFGTRPTQVVAFRRTAQIVLSPIEIDAQGWERCGSRDEGLEVSIDRLVPIHRLNGEATEQGRVKVA